MANILARFNELIKVRFSKKNGENSGEQHVFFLTITNLRD